MGRGRLAAGLGVMAAAAVLAGACTRADRPAEKPVEEQTSGRSDAGPPPRPTHRIPRPREAEVELGILTARGEEELEALAAPAAAGARLGARQCGEEATCAAVRAFLSEPGRYQAEVRTAEEWGLPPPDTLDTVARGLAPAARAALPGLPRVLVIRVKGKAGSDQLPARAGFGVTAALALHLGAPVYDEVTRRIETAEAFAEHAITGPLGETAFRPDRIVIQLYEHDGADAAALGNGGARLLTLGMRRFGAPDVEVRGAPLAQGMALGRVVNAVARRLADGTRQAPFAITLDDVARAIGQDSKALHAGADTPRPVTVDLAVGTLEEGNPDNALLRLVPEGDAGAASFEAMLSALFGATSQERVVSAPDDSAVKAASARARAQLPAALTKWKQQKPKMLVKLPFRFEGPYGGGDAGGTEWMWVEVRKFDATTIGGVLTNSPTYAGSVRAGDSVTGKRADVFDWLMQWPDGGVEGGETSKLLDPQLRGRAPGAPLDAARSPRSW